MAFINRDFLQGNLLVKQIPRKKIHINKQDVHLSFLMARPTKDGYKIIYTINIISKNDKSNPTRPIPLRDIDMISLRNAIELNMRPYDRQYIKIVNFDNLKVEFLFDHKKWLNDSLSGIRPLTKYSQFSKEFKLRKRLPFMILQDPMQKQFEQFILKKFFEYMESRRKEFTWFRGLLPDGMKNKLRLKVRDMFNWTYDFSWNRIIATMKPLYILGLIAATGMLVKKLNKNTIKYNQFMFAKQVKKNLKKFDLKKFNKITKQNKNLF